MNLRHGFKKEDGFFNENKLRKNRELLEIKRFNNEKLKISKKWYVALIYCIFII